MNRLPSICVCRLSFHLLSVRRRTYLECPRGLEAVCEDPLKIIPINLVESHPLECLPWRKKENAKWDRISEDRMVLKFRDRHKSRRTVKWLRKARVVPSCIETGK